MVERYFCPRIIMAMTVRIVNNSPHPLPEYQTSGSAGVDLRAWLKEPVELQPLERKAIPTGLFLHIPEGFEAQIRPRSGMALKRGLGLVNSVGTIDSDYRGEIMVPIINLSNEVQRLEDGERIAQMVFARYEQVLWQPVHTLEETLRGVGGFGSTGT